MSYDEDDLVPLSALQHLVFCERRCALVHLEGEWADNVFTVEGQHLHDKAHESDGRTEVRGDLRIARGLMLRSFRLGLSGKTDVVEFHRVAEGGARLLGARGLWRPFPVEYKRGRPQRDRCYEVQLCAQAICLEEMLGTDVPEGALFFGTTRHRFDVTIDATLRGETEHAALRLHQLLGNRKTPPAVREPKCDRCSLIEICMPGARVRGRSARTYLDRAIRAGLLEPPHTSGGA